MLGSLHFTFSHSIQPSCAAASYCCCFSLLTKTPGHGCVLYHYTMHACLQGANSTALAQALATATARGHESNATAAATAIAQAKVWMSVIASMAADGWPQTLVTTVDTITKMRVCVRACVHACVRKSVRKSVKASTAGLVAPRSRWLENMPRLRL